MSEEKPGERVGEWVNFIRGELQYNREQSEVFHTQNVKILERIALLEIDSRNRLEHVVDELRRTRGDVSKDLQETRSMVQTEMKGLLDKQHKLDIELVRINSKAGVWGMLAGMIPALAALIWYLLTKKTQ